MIEPRLRLCKRYRFLRYALEYCASGASDPLGVREFLGQALPENIKQVLVRRVGIVFAAQRESARYLFSS